MQKAELWRAKLIPSVKPEEFSQKMEEIGNSVKEAVADIHQRVKDSALAKIGLTCTKYHREWRGDSSTPQTLKQYVEQNRLFYGACCILGACGCPCWPLWLLCGTLGGAADGCAHFGEIEAHKTHAQLFDPLIGNRPIPCLGCQMVNHGGTLEEATQTMVEAAVKQYMVAKSHDWMVQYKQTVKLSVREYCQFSGDEPPSNVKMDD